MTTHTTIHQHAKVALCQVYFADDYVRVESPTGTKLTLPIGERSNRSHLFEDEQALLGKLLDPNGDCETPMTYEEMKLFASMVKRYKGKLESKPGVAPLPSAGVSGDATPVQSAPALVSPTAPTAPVVIPPVAAPAVSQDSGSAPQATLAPVAPVVTSSAAPATSNPPVPFSPVEADYFRERRERMIQAHRERQMRALATEATDNDTIWEVKYYVPSAVSQPPMSADRPPMFADLARRMRRARLLKFDGSCYYGRERHIPRHIGKEIEIWNNRPEVKATEFSRPSRRLLCKWEAEPVTAERMAKIKGQAFLQLLDLTTEVYDAMRESIENASDTHAQSLANMEQEVKEGREGPTNRKLYEAEDKRIKAISSAISRARTELKLAVECAEAFGEREALEELVHDIGNGIREYQQQMEADRVALREMPRQ